MATIDEFRENFRTRVLRRMRKNDQQADDRRALAGEVFQEAARAILIAQHVLKEMDAPSEIRFADWEFDRRTAALTLEAALIDNQGKRHELRFIVEDQPAIEGLDKDAIEILETDEYGDRDVANRPRRDAYLITRTQYARVANAVEDMLMRFFERN